MGPVVGPAPSEILGIGLLLQPVGRRLGQPVGYAVALGIGDGLLLGVEAEAAAAAPCRRRRSSPSADRWSARSAGSYSSTQVGLALAGLHGVAGRSVNACATALSSPLRSVCNKMVGAARFEPTTPCAQGRCATRLRYAPRCERSHRAGEYPFLVPFCKPRLHQPLNRGCRTRSPGLMPSRAATPPASSITALTGRPAVITSSDSGLVLAAIYDHAAVAGHEHHVERDIGVLHPHRRLDRRIPKSNSIA